MSKRKELELRGSIKARPHDAELRYELGELLLDRIDSGEEAIKQLRKSIKLDPTNDKFKDALADAIVTLKRRNVIYAQLRKTELPEWPLVGDFGASERRTQVQEFNRQLRNTNSE